MRYLGLSHATMLDIGGAFSLPHLTSLELRNVKTLLREDGDFLSLCTPTALPSLQELRLDYDPSVTWGLDGVRSELFPLSTVALSTLSSLIPQLSCLTMAGLEVDDMLQLLSSDANLTTLEICGPEFDPDLLETLCTLRVKVVVFSADEHLDSYVEEDWYTLWYDRIQCVKQLASIVKKTTTLQSLKLYIAGRTTVTDSRYLESSEIHAALNFAIQQLFNSCKQHGVTLEVEDAC